VVNCAFVAAAVAHVHLHTHTNGTTAQAAVFKQLVVTIPVKFTGLALLYARL
jgi:hypothetical protein